MNGPAEPEPARSERGEWVKVDLDELAAAGLEAVWFADAEIELPPPG